MANKHHKTEKEKTAQHMRTKANKIRRIEKMLKENPSNEQAIKRLAYWKAR